MSRRLAGATLTIGLLLVAGSAIAWSSSVAPQPPRAATLPTLDPATPEVPTSDTPAAAAPAGPRSSAPTEGATPAPEDAASPRREVPTTGAAPRAAARSDAATSWAARPATVLGRRSADVGTRRPLRLRLPDAGIDAAVVPVGVTADGQMEVPVEVATAGWYRYGATPGRRGATVIAGHVDSRTQGRGAFFDLVDVTPGDRLTIDVDRGGAARYVVRDIRRIDKADLPLDRLFRRDGRETLHLVTCGGPFDAAAGSYRSNIVVTAVPLTGT